MKNPQKSTSGAIERLHWCEVELWNAFRDTATCFRSVGKNRQRLTSRPAGNWEKFEAFWTGKICGKMILRLLHPLEPGQSRKKSFNIPKHHFSFLPLKSPCNFHDLRSQVSRGFQSTLKSCRKARHPKPVGRLFQERFQWVNSSDKTPAWNRAVNSTGPQQRKTLRW